MLQDLMRNVRLIFYDVSKNKLIQFTVSKHGNKT